MSFELSPYQNEIVQYVKDRKGCLLIEAVAGAAKTTTLTEIAKVIPKDESLFLAYNSHIKKHLQEKLPSGFTCKTLHAHGFAAWRTHVGGSVMVQAKKVDYIIDEILENDPNPGTLFKLRSTVKKVVDLCKNAGMVPEDKLKFLAAWTPENFDDMFEKYSISMKLDELAKGNVDAAKKLKQKTIEYAAKVLEINNKDHDVIDFGDQLYFPYIFGVIFKKYNFILIDEMQDLSAIQFELIYKSATKKSILVGCGDRKQAIYSWRGSDSSLMDEFVKRTNAPRSQLPICYRCPEQVVKLAQQYNPLIQVWEGSEKGNIENIGNSFNPDDFEYDDLVLSRFNAVLLATACEFMKARKPIKFAGREMEGEIKSMIKMFDAATVNDLLYLVKDYVDRKIKWLEPRGMLDEVNRLTDLYFSIVTLGDMVDKGKNPRYLGELVDRIFNSSQGVTFSTIHKAKGLEADTVWFIDSDKLPYVREGQKEWSSEQERNLVYVALTRAKTNLYFIKSPKNFRDKYYKEEQTNFVSRGRVQTSEEFLKEMELGVLLDEQLKEIEQELRSDEDHY